MKRFVRWAGLWLGLVALARAADAGPADYDTLKAAAEKLFAEKSYASAKTEYDKAAALKLAPDQQRWVAFRQADCAWRDQAASRQTDPSKFEAARQQLVAMVRDVKRAEYKDRIWAEIQESLGDSHWRRQEANWGQAWTYYNQALEWWAGRSDLETARVRYLAIVKRCAWPPWREGHYAYGYYGNQLPQEVLENALKIAKQPEEQAWAHYLAAVSLRNHNAGPFGARRIAGLFEQALSFGRNSDWYDDALFQYAQVLEQGGRAVTNDDGSVTMKPDYVAAAAMYKRVTDEFKKGETRWWDNAQQQFKNITGPQLGVGVGQHFLPDDKPFFGVNWRNVKLIEFTLYRFDGTRDVDLAGKGDQNWLQALDPATLTKAQSWTLDTKDDGTHVPGAEQQKVAKALAPGAYLLVATGGGQSAREYVLVTDRALAVKNGKQAVAWFCSAMDGEPVAKGTVRIWQQYHENGKNHWRLFEGATGPDGLAKLDWKDGNHFVAFASDGTNQAIAQGYGGRVDAQRISEWRIYAFTDRTAYRPGETVQWRFVARIRDSSGAYATPVEQKLTYEIYDPRGAKVAESNVVLNAFGSAGGELAVTPQMPLGSYTVQFKNGGNHVGQAELFRMEEFKLPEFKVAVKTPEENGRRKAYLLGERVEAEIQADYYFGGPVANASVQVLIRKRPHHRFWYPPCEFGWFYKDFRQERPWWGGEGEVVRQETIKTDSQGRAKIAFDTERSGQELEYSIEARVTDSSRREIVGKGSVRVGSQRYFVHATPANRLPKPNTKAEITLRAFDPNDQPISVTGRVKVTQLKWREIWISPMGEEVTGPALRDARAASLIWPPLPPPNRPPWRCKDRRYVEEDVLTQTVTIPTNGETSFVFTPAKEGYYAIRWNSPQQDAMPVKAETFVWVCNENTRDLGYLRQGGVEILVDKDTFREGEKASVMLASPASGRWVLFGVEGEQLYDVQVVKIEGAVKLVQFDIAERHVPNVFLTAGSFNDGQYSSDQKQVIVPPLKHYLSVTVSTDRAAYQPREDAKVSIQVTDHAGKPVEAQVSLAVADEAVLYIQQEIAGDPREFYYGDKRGQQIATHVPDRPLLRVREEPASQDEQGVVVGWDTDGDRLVEKEMRWAGAGFGGGGRSRRGAFALAAASAPMAAPAELAVMDAAMPMAAAPAPARRKAEMKKDVLSNEGATAGGPGGQEPVVVVRTDFRATALWKPDLVTDKKGVASATCALPDSLTSWQAKARVVTKDNQFGIADVTFPSRMPLICRLQAPRFFVAGDTCTVSAVVNNNTDEKMTVKVDLAITGVALRAVSGANPATVEVPARGEARVDWSVAAATAGDVKLKMTARAAKYADAMEKPFTVAEHGIDKLIAISGKVRGKSATLKLDLPAARRAGSTEFTVQVSPSIAGTMLDALPYLADYPYGCTEQTMSRFLPAVVVSKTLADLGLDAGVVADTLFGGIEASNRVARTNTIAKLDDMVKAGLDRLYDFQHGDGGWGWWKEGDSDPYMTAYVLWGLSLAQDAGVKVKDGTIGRGLDWLEKKLVEAEENPDLQAWELHALAAHKRSSKMTAKAMDNLWQKRDGLNAYSRALFLTATVRYGDPNKTAAILARNLRDGVKKDDRPDLSIVQEGAPTASSSGLLGTAHWGSDGLWWRWSDGPIESTAFGLMALLAADPTSDLVEPVMTWMVRNRRGAQWSNTRDTAISVLALCQYLKATGELKPDVTYEVVVNGRKIGERRITAENALGAPAKFTVPADLVRDGTNEIKIVRTRGEGALYASAQAAFFSLEEPIESAGHELFVRRQYYRIAPRPTLLKGVVYDREPLDDGGAVKSGDRIEVVVTVESKNDYEYVLFEDLKPAGFEAVEVRSGGNLFARELKSGDLKTHLNKSAKVQSQIGQGQSGGDYTGRQRWIYQELRDRKVAMFADKLPEGVWELRYELRAETPGAFHALPVMAHAMYVPEIKANGREVRVSVRE